MAGKKIAMEFNILIKKEDDYFLAHCLELDIVATAGSLEAAHKEMVDLICAQVDYAFSNDNVENLYHSAPKEAWEEFFACKESTESTFRVRSGLEKGDSSTGFVPPWIIARTCHAQQEHHA